MRGTLVEVGLELGLDLRGRAPIDHGIHQPITAAVLQIAFVKTEAKPVLVIIGQAHVRVQRSARGLACQHRVLAQANFLLADDDALTAHRGVGHPDLRGSDVVGKGAQGALAGELGHLRTERSDHDALFGRRTAEGGPSLIHTIEIGAHGRERLLVFVSAQIRYQRRMGYTEAEHETLAVQFVQTVVPHHRGGGIPRIDVGDTTRHYQLLAMAEQIAADGERFVVEGFGIPQGGITQFLHTPRQLGKLCSIHRVSKGKYAVCAEFHYRASLGVMAQHTG